MFRRLWRAGWLVVCLFLPGVAHAQGDAQNDPSRLLDRQREQARQENAHVVVSVSTTSPPPDIYTTSSPAFFLLAPLYERAAGAVRLVEAAVDGLPNMSPECTALLRNPPQNLARAWVACLVKEREGQDASFSIQNADALRRAFVVLGKSATAREVEPAGGRTTFSVAELRAAASAGVARIYVAYPATSTAPAVDYDLYVAVDLGHFKAAPTSTLQGPAVPTVGRASSASTGAAAPPGRPAGPPRIVEIALDRVGVASPKFLNPRDPRYLFGDAPLVAEAFTSEEWAAYLRSIAFGLRFTTRENDLVSIVTIGRIKDKFRSRFELAGATIENCAQGVCEARVFVAYGAPALLPGDLLYEALIDDRGYGKLTRFTVSQFEDVREPGRPVGYFTIVDRSRYVEPESTSKWSANAIGTLAFEPDVDALKPSKDLPPVITSTRPLGAADRLEHATGRTALRFRQTLNTRAAAEVELQARAGDFGGLDTTRAVSLSQYRVEVFGSLGASLSFGRYDVALPSDGIAIRERGDAIGLSFLGLFSVTHVIKRESEAAKADTGNKDNWSVVMQAKDVLIKRVRTSWFGVIGEEDLAVKGDKSPRDDPHRYWTLGGEGAFDVPGTGWQHSLASYVSGRNPGRCGFACGENDGEVEGRATGWVTLYKGSFTKLLPVTRLQGPVGEMLKRRTAPKVDFIAGVTLGHGSGDTLRERRDEGYVGETAGFGADGMFLSRLAALVRTGATPTRLDKVDPACLIEPCARAETPHRELTDPNGNGQVGAGLSNKLFVSAFYTSRRFSLLDPIRQYVFRTEEAGFRSTTVRVSRYRFNEPVFGEHDGGVGAELETQLEAPRGIRHSVSAGCYWRGSALVSLVPARVWYAMASVTVDLK